MSIKTLIVLAIFGALIFVYAAYMSKEVNKSSKKIEAFEEATQSLKASLIAATKDVTAATPTNVVTPATVTPATATHAPTTATATATATNAGTSTIASGVTPALSTTTPPQGTPKAQKRDLEKSLFIVNKYEEIFGSKIGPEELDSMSIIFADVDDKDVITYKLKEMKYKSNDEVDTIFELVDVTYKLSSIVNKLKARAGAKAEVPSAQSRASVEGYASQPSYLPLAL